MNGGEICTWVQRFETGTSLFQNRAKLAVLGAKRCSERKDVLKKLSRSNFIAINVFNGIVCVKSETERRLECSKHSFVVFVVVLVLRISSAN